MNKVTIRELSKSEIANLSNTEHKYWRRINSALEESNIHQVIACYIDTKPIGFLHSKISLDKYPIPGEETVLMHWEPRYIYVEKEYRQQGIASKMFPMCCSFVTQIAKAQTYTLNLHLAIDPVSIAGRFTSNSLEKMLIAQLKAVDIQVM